MVGHTALRKVIGPDPFAAVAGSHLALAVLGRFRTLGFLGDFQHLGPQNPHRLFLVLQLGFFILALHHHAGRQMSDPNRRFGLVDVLATGAAGAIGINTQIILVDLHVDILDFRQYRHRNRGSMDAAGRLGIRHPLHPVHAAFELQTGIGSRAGNAKNHFLETAKVRGIGIHHFDPPALRLGVARIHPEQVPGEQRRFLAAGAATDFHDDVLVVVRVFG